MIRWTASLTLVLAIGCTPDDQYQLGGLTMYDLFPFDGNRTWEFINEDKAVTWWLRAETREEDPIDDLVEGHTVYHVDYTKYCRGEDENCTEGDLVRSIGWSSDVNDGVLIHSFTQGPAELTYDPPLQVAGREMNVGDVSETTTDGYNFTSTLVAMEFCPVEINNDWGPNCAHFRIEDGDTDPVSNQGLVGDYWAVKGLNVVAIDLEGDFGAWGLQTHECTPDEDCRGDW
jgi:hypothetical protein